MITIVLTYRNRDLSIVNTCLQSFNNQTNKQFNVILVNYGSSQEYNIEINKLTQDYPFLSIINCNVKNQLWCKSRAINIALKTCETPYFFVGDVDMIYNPNFIERLFILKENNDVVYFQVGFLSQSESLKTKAFKDYDVNFKSTKEATGMTLYKTEVLKAINGYDEFYNGWGSEDTDTHVRLRSAKNNVLFYNSELLMLHQWHPKMYRKKSSTAPFHSNLEKINQKYLEYTKRTHKNIANTKFEWGQYNDEDYQLLNAIDIEFDIANELSEVKGFINNVLLNLKDKVISIAIKPHEEYKSLKYFAKKILGKKTKQFFSMQEVNDVLLETIIMYCRNNPYSYAFNQSTQKISLVIKL